MRLRKTFPTVGKLAATVMLGAQTTLSGLVPAWAQVTPSTPNVPSIPAVPDIRTTNTPSNIILPTDVLPLPAVQNRLTFGENFQLRMLQKLPSNLYFSSSCETSFRIETNPFQFPTKRELIRQIPQAQPPLFYALTPGQQQQVRNIIGLASAEDVVFRVLPNVTGGFTLTPRTRVFANYFMIRDQLAEHVRLNTVIHSIAYGLQQDIPIGSRANLQAEMQFRELYQLNQQPVFDFLPGLTLSYVATPRLILFANTLLQLRGKKYFQAPTKEIDPFYTWGGLYQRNGWTFSASSTFVQNFREPFRGNATIPINNYAFILDFEIARRLVKQVPGLQAFARAEPIYNFKSNNTPGLAGMDFRMFFGLRMAVAKPSLAAGLQNLREQIEEQEQAPPAPKEQAPETKPSAYRHYELITHKAQPMHGYLPIPQVQEAAVNEAPKVVARRPRSKEEMRQFEQERKHLEEERLKVVAELEQKPDPHKISMVLVPPLPSINIQGGKVIDPGIEPSDIPRNVLP